MSGIAGIIDFGRSVVDPARIDGMVQTIRHRGPDRQKMWCGEHAAIAALLLQTTRESLSEELPFEDTEAQLVIAADARLDNRDELLEQLGRLPDRGVLISDSAIILEAYKKWGHDCCGKLLGDFAVVVWDKKERSLFAFRDHLGVRPLYYYHSNTFFAFASEIKALLAIPEVPYRVNEERIADFMAIQDDHHSTFYQDIYILPPAHLLRCSQTAFEVRNFWQLALGPRLRLRDDNEYAEAFREMFFRSVRCRLRGIDPIGSNLSGGLDSSSVSAAARDILVQEGREKLHTFSFYFEELKECDERSYFAPVINQGNVTAHLVQADKFPTRAEYDRLQIAFEGAVSALNVNPPWRVAQCAAQNGVRILLSGFDGDTTVSHGTGRFIELARSMRWLKLYRECSGYGGYFNVPTTKLITYYLRNYSVLTGLLDWNSQIKRNLAKAFKDVLRKNGSKSKPTFLNDQFYQAINAATRYQRCKQPFNKQDFNEQRWHLQRLTAPSLARNLGLAERCAAHVSVEERYPFMDIRLMEFCLSLPACQKLDQGWNRVIMRRAMASSLPPVVCWRGGKADLGPHADAVALRLLKMYDLDDPLKNSLAFVYLNRRKVENAIQSAVANGKKFAGDELLCRIIGLMIWLQTIDDDIQVGQAA